MPRKIGLHVKFGILYAAGTAAQVLVLAAAIYGLSLVEDSFYFYFAGLFIVLVSCVGYLIGDFYGRRIESKQNEVELEMQSQVEAMQELLDANASLQTEALDLKKHRKELLSIMEDAERSNSKLQKEVAERTRAEAEAAEARRNIELVLHGGDLGYWDWNIVENTFDFNDRFAAILGVSAGDIELNVDWRGTHIHPEDFDLVSRTLNFHMDGKASTYACEYRIRRGNDDWIWVFDRGRVIERNSDHHPMRMVGTLLDVTVRKKHELELKEANRLLDKRSRELEENQHLFMGMMEDANNARDKFEQANRQLVAAREKAEQATRAKSDFLASMSHEIRTPMNGIIGTTSLMHTTQLSDEQREYLRIIQTSSDTLLTLVNDILDFSKVEAGRLDLEPKPFNLLEVCEEVAEAQTPTALQKGIELILRFAPETPSTMVGDAGRIRQVLMNLVGNALKFTRKGYVYLNVEAVACLEAGVKIQFAVIDTGIGISKDEHPQLFQKFSQVDSSTTREYGGTGLGLAICKQLVSLMDGTIGMESEPGKGSVFWFMIVLPVDMKMRAPIIDKTFFDKERVLVIDETVIAGKAIAEWLVRWGLVADIAASLSEAATMIRDNSYQIVLVEEHLAYDTDSLLFNNPEAEQFVLFVLSSASNRDFQALERSGLATNLVKPIRLANLLAKTATALGYTIEAGLPSTQIRPATVQPEVETPSEGQPTAYRVLLVEDNLVNQTVAKRMLIKGGCEVDVAENGEQAANKVREGAMYDIIFMDCQMPRMDGYEASRQIRRFEEGNKPGTRIPIVALTANAMMGDREKCMEAGMDDYIAKPIKKEAIFEMIQRHLW